MNINELTIGQAKELAALFSNQQPTETLNCMINKRVIIRTYSAGCWYGILEQKSGNEVVINNARRMWRWWAEKGISLSSVAIHGIKHDKSKIEEAVSSVWLEAIEIIPCTQAAIESLEGAPHVKVN